LEGGRYKIFKDKNEDVLVDITDWSEVYLEAVIMWVKMFDCFWYQLTCYPEEKTIVALYKC